MSRRKSHKYMQESAAELGPDDGIDPKQWFHSEAPKRGRKGLQLCGQIREALYWVLGSQAGDDWLAHLEVHSVQPLGNTSQILITLVAPEDIEIEHATGKVQAASRAIRAEIAAAIHRRKVPDLFFRIVHKS